MHRLTPITGLVLCVGVALGPPTAEAFWERRGLEAPQPVSWVSDQHRTAARFLLRASGQETGPPAESAPDAGREPSDGSTLPTEAAASPSPAVSLSGVEAGPEVLRDQVYAQDSPAQRLDLHLPVRDGSRAIPVVVNIHGGAFSGGDKVDESYNHEALLAAGIAVADVNYRLSGEAAFPAGAQDVKAAIIWLRTHAAEYGIDPTKFVAWGRSAGAYMAIMAGVTNGQKTLFDVAGHENTTADDVQAVVGVYPPTDFATMNMHARDNPACKNGYQDHDAPDSPESTWLRAPVPESPQTSDANLSRYAASVAPPQRPDFWLFHGSDDCTVPSGQSQMLADSLQKAGATAHLEIVGGAGHADAGVDARAVTVAVPGLIKLFANG